MPSSADATPLEVDGRTVVITHPDKLLFPEAGVRKLDLVRYFIAVADGALRGAGGRPCVLVRHPDGVGGEFFFQKRAPAQRPPWMEVVQIRFPSGRTAEEVVPRSAADLAWMANLACLELHPHPVRAEDLEHPDELRIDLDPVPGVGWRQIVEVAQVARAALQDFGLVGWPKTSGSRGVHVLVRIERRWSFDQVRRAALALAREIERRVPALATSKWWKEERHGVFVDYNQNARDRTVAAAYSVRPKPDARVSAPVTWEELAACEPADFTLRTMPARFARLGDLHAGIDAAACSLQAVLELSARQEAAGQADAPWPPYHRKASGEPKRTSPAGGKKAAPARGKTAQAQLAAVPAAKKAAGSAAEAAPAKKRVRKPLVEIGRARREADVQAGIERWKARHPEAAAHLQPADVLLDRMRGSSSLWYRGRVNLQNVPAALRPRQEALDPDEPLG